MDTWIACPRGRAVAMESTPYVYFSLLSLARLFCELTLCSKKRICSFPSPTSRPRGCLPRPLLLLSSDCVRLERHAEVFIVSNRHVVLAALETVHDPQVLTWMCQQTANGTMQSCTYFGLLGTRVVETNDASLSQMIRGSPHGCGKRTYLCAAVEQKLRVADKTLKRNADIQLHRGQRGRKKCYFKRMPGQG